MKVRFPGWDEWPVPLRVLLAFAVLLALVVSVAHAPWFPDMPWWVWMLAP